MKEEHIQVGDIKRFLHQMQHALKKKKLVKTKETIPMYAGLKIIVNKYVPKNRAILIDKNGQVKQIFNL